MRNLRLSIYKIVIFLLLLFFFGCAASPVVRERSGIYGIEDISKGLPAEDLWRENVVLFDIDGDGRLDIVTPPPRMAPEGKRRPFIFVRDKDGWKEGNYVFPEGKEYNYGGVAAGDINGDGKPDIVLAEHARGITLFMNDGKGGFATSPLEVEDFHSRAIELADLRGSGRLDIIAVSEGTYVQGYEPKGILVGINEGGKGWDVKVMEKGMLGDFAAVGNIAGKGNKDVAVAHMASEPEKKLVWFGDGKGRLELYNGDIVGNHIPYLVRVGDVDGDGKDEVAFRLAGIGKDVSTTLGVFSWTGEGFKNISSGLEKVAPIVFDFADLDGDGKKELVVLQDDALYIYKYLDAIWVEQAKHDISPTDTKGARDLKAGKNSDGSWFIVYNLGFKNPEFNSGIKAFLVGKH